MKYSILLLASLILQGLPLSAQSEITGTIVNHQGSPVAGCKISTDTQSGTPGVSDAQGRISFHVVATRPLFRQSPRITFRGNGLHWPSAAQAALSRVSLHGLDGSFIQELSGRLYRNGSLPFSAVRLKDLNGVYWLRVRLGQETRDFKVYAMEGRFLPGYTSDRTASPTAKAAMAKPSAAADSLRIQCAGYLVKKLPFTPARPNLGKIAVRKPNVLFIAIDDFRPETKAYGKSHMVTPNLDRFAKASIVFKRAYVNNPVCGASRASMMTSTMPTRNRWLSAEEKIDVSTPGAVTLAQAFKDAGYYTLANGKILHYQTDAQDRSWSEPAWDSEYGMFHYNDPVSGTLIGGTRDRTPWVEWPDVADTLYGDGAVTEKSKKDLERLARKEQPFFLAVGYKRPHLPFYAPKKYWDLYDRDRIKLADNRFTPRNAPTGVSGSAEIKSYHDRNIAYNSDEWHKVGRHGYYASVSYVDALLGNLLAKLDELRLRDSTIVVVWGDHGFHLGEHNFWGKHNTLHNAIHIPLMFSVPGYQAASTDALVETVDIFPTLTDLAGIRPPENQIAGKSLAPILEKPELPGKAFVYTRYSSTYDAIVTRDYVFTTVRKGAAPANWMLFDRRTDPDENDNIANTPGGKPISERYFAKIDSIWKSETRWPGGD